MTLGATGPLVTGIVRLRVAYDGTQAKQAKQDVRELESHIARAGEAAALLSNRFRTAFLISSAGVIGVSAAFKNIERSEIQLARVTNLSGGAFQRLAKDVKDLGKELGLTEVQAVDLATGAARAGIQGKDLTTFMRTARSASVILNQDVNATADTLARLRQNLELSVPELNNLTGAVLALDNVSAAAFPEILEAMTRVGPLARLMGLSGDQLAALSAVVVETGISAEVTGTALAQVMQSLLRRSEKLAPLLGTTGAELRRIAKENPLFAIQRVAQAFAKLNEEGADTSEFLTALGLDGRRATSVLAVLGDRTGRLGELIGTSGEEMKKGTILTRLFGLQAEALQQKWDQFKASFLSAVAEIGRTLGPFIKGLLDGLRRIFDTISNSRLLQVAIGFGLIATVVGSLAGFMTFFAASQVIAFKVAAEGLPQVIGLYKQLATAMTAASVAQGGGGGLLGGLRRRFALMREVKATAGFRATFGGEALSPFAFAFPKLAGMGTTLVSAFKVFIGLASRLVLPLTVIMAVFDAIQNNLFGARDALVRLVEPFRQVFGGEGAKSLQTFGTLLQGILRVFGQVAGLLIRVGAEVLMPIMVGLAKILEGILYLVNLFAPQVRAAANVLGLGLGGGTGTAATVVGGTASAASPRVVTVTESGNVGSKYDIPITINNPVFRTEEDALLMRDTIDRAIKEALSKAGEA